MITTDERRVARVRGPAALWLLLAALTPLGACQSDDGAEDDDDDMLACPDAAAAADAGPVVIRAALEDVCLPDAGAFSTTIDNPFFPMPVGAMRVLEGDEAGTALRVEHLVLDETEEVAGVTTRVLQETEYEDEELVEISRNFFAQADDGTVCYFGEDVDIYEGGEIVAHEGAWRAGVNGALPGIIMPADPQLGMSYAQETAPDDDAWDHASHVAEGQEITVPGGTFTDTLRTIEWTPIEPNEVSRKAYARGIGMIVDNLATLASYEE